jgi:hypothetical protein
MLEKERLARYGRWGKSLTGHNPGITLVARNVHVTIACTPITDVFNKELDSVKRQRIKTTIK